MLTEFLVDILKVNKIEGSFPHKVGLHQSCHGLRELRLGSSSELVGLTFNKARLLLESLDGIQISELTRPDECCGFGGTFSVKMPEVSTAMLDHKLDELQMTPIDVLAAVDSSCLMQIRGRLERRGSPVRTMHLAEILASR